jgi:hypothetical protein
MFGNFNRCVSIKVLSIIVICILSPTCLWSQASEPYDLSMDRKNIETVLIGTWRTTGFAIPGRLEMSWTDNILKDALYIHPYSKYISFSTGGICQTSGDNHADNNSFKWELKTSSETDRFLTLLLLGDDFIDPFEIELMVFDSETILSVSVFIDENDQRFVFSEFWNKVDSK